MNFYDEIRAAYQEPPKESKETLLNYDDRFTLQSLIGYLKHFKSLTQPFVSMWTLTLRRTLLEDVDSCKIEE